jgi:hypothetical protein
MGERRTSTDTDPWNTTSRLPLSSPSNPVYATTDAPPSGFSDGEALGVAPQRLKVVIREGDDAGRFLTHKTYDIQIDTITVSR